MHKDEHGYGSLISTRSTENEIVLATLEATGVVVATKLPPVLTTEEYVLDLTLDKHVS